MASQSETAGSSHNVQDLFLDGARLERLTVTVQLMDGTVKNSDRLAIVLEHDGVDQLVFKHAVAHIRPALSTA